MAIIKSFNGISPVIHDSCFIAENATITGDVKIDTGTSIWYQSVIRGDVCSIEIGKDVNVQDASIIHGTLNLSKVVIADKVSIGHRAIIHGCTIEGAALIGMGAIILDNAIIQENSIIAAGSVVLQNTVIESGYLYGGIPAVKIKKLDTSKLAYYVDGTAESYRELAKLYKEY